MRSSLEDGRLQITAAAALLDRSRLVHWNADLARFIPVSRDIFEAACREVDPAFGRLICWMLFSAGAEFLAKGVCLTRGVDMRRHCDVPACPDGDIDEWAAEFLKEPSCGGTSETTYWHYGAVDHQDRTVAQTLQPRWGNPKGEESPPSCLRVAQNCG